MRVLLFHFTERQRANTAAQGFNHLPFLKMDILVAPKVNGMLQLACPALPTGTQVCERVLKASGRTAEGNIVQDRESDCISCFFGSAALPILTSESQTAL